MVSMCLLSFFFAMPPKNLVDQERVRARILELHAAGKGYGEIARHADVNRSRATVQSIVTRFGNREEVADKPRPGRPSKMNARCIFAGISIGFSKFSLPQVQEKFEIPGGKRAPLGCKGPDRAPAPVLGP